MEEGLSTPSDTKSPAVLARGLMPKKMGLAWPESGME